MKPKLKRPITIWIAVTLLSLYAVYVFAAVGYVMYVYSSLPFHAPDIFRMVFLKYFFVLIAALASLVSVRLILKRRNWGRRIAVAAMLFMMFNHLNTQFASNPQLRSVGSASDAAVAALLLSLGMLPNVLTIALLTVGKRTNAYFRSSEKPKIEAATEPPPPPVFES